MAGSFQVELVKLLLAVAWADHRIVRTEADMVRDVARTLGLTASELAEVERWLGNEASLPAADLELLKPHKHAVLAAAHTLVMADDRIAPEEAALLHEIERALG